jgi:hypothetical protein
MCRYGMGAEFWNMGPPSMGELAASRQRAACLRSLKYQRLNGVPQNCGLDCSLGHCHCSWCENRNET